MPSQLASILVGMVLILACSASWAQTAGQQPAIVVEATAEGADRLAAGRVSSSDTASLLAGVDSAYTELDDQQEYVNKQVLAVFNDEAKSAAPIRVAEPAALTPSDIQSMLILLAESDIKLNTLQSLMKTLDDMYIEALKDS